MLLTERAADLRDYSGRVTFPGGAHDRDDHDAITTALREAREEVGLDPESVHVVATLPGFALPESGFLVTPVLAWSRAPSLRASQHLGGRRRSIRPVGHSDRHGSLARSSSRRPNLAGAATPRRAALQVGTDDPHADRSRCSLGALRRRRRPRGAAPRRSGSGSDTRAEGVVMLGSRSRLTPPASGRPPRHPWLIRLPDAASARPQAGTVAADVLDWNVRPKILRPRGSWPVAGGIGRHKAFTADQDASCRRASGGRALPLVGVVEAAPSRSADDKLRSAPGNATNNPEHRPGSNSQGG